MNPETKKRVQTGVVAGSLFLGLLIFGGYLGVSFLCVLIALGMVWECSNMFLHLNDRQEKQRALLGVAWCVLFVNILAPKSLVETLVMANILYFAYYLAIANRHETNLKEHLTEYVYSCFTLTYFVGCMVFMPLIRGGSGGLHWILLLFVCIWCSDTGAYFAGRKYGGPKLYPVISPGKTVSGLYGGIGAAVFGSLLYKLLFFKGISWLGVFIVPVVLTVVSQVGDLCESFVKRAFKVKDSGNLLPGHGGIWDRFDGVVFAMPIMYILSRTF